MADDVGAGGADSTVTSSGGPTGTEAPLSTVPSWRPPTTAAASASSEGSRLFQVSHNARLVAIAIL